MKVKLLLKHLVIITAISAGFAVCLDADVRYPAPGGYVTDTAGIISRDARMQIENLLGGIERKTTAEIAVVTVPSTSPLTIEQYAVGLFEKWGIGKKGKDNGVLILVASVDRKVRIEVGYGLEGVITDLESKFIIEKGMIPYFKQGNYTAGVVTAITRISKLIGEEYGIEIDPERMVAAVPLKGGRRQGSPASALLSFLFFVLIFGFRFGSLFFFMSGAGRRSYWSGGSGGSFGGGFGGFGGGFSGGGGASGSW